MLVSLSFNSSNLLLLPAFERLHGKKEKHRKVMHFPATREIGNKQNIKQQNCLR
jgi:hypothetical protein